MTDTTQTDVATKANILLVDDDEIILDSLGGFLANEGYDVTTAQSVEQATQRLQAGRYNLVISDVTMPGRDGFELLRYARANHEDVFIIMITGYGTIHSAVEAIKLGAYEYLTKPIIDDDVRMAVQRALQQQQLLAENRNLRAVLSDRYSFASIVGADFRMAKVFDLIEAVADSRSTVLITGESGTGKTLIARAIHTHSARHSKPFVEVSCGALPETLLESELFGHARGAFTGAVADKPGKFAAAEGGTLFLDEISSASAQLQAKLLRVLQERQFEPVGSNETHQADVRVVLASNRDLQAEVDAGRFRRDLYYRVNVVNIELPPLRERLGDIPLLAEHFLTKHLRETDRPVRGFSPETIAVMQRYDWPGNVRELENCVERAVILCRQGLVEPGDLPPTVRGSADADGAPSTHPEPATNLQEALATPEKRIIEAALQANGGSRKATAEQLGINRTTLYKKMRKYGLMEGRNR